MSDQVLKTLGFEALKTDQAVEEVDYIDLTPTWQGLIPAFVAVLGNPDADHSAKQTIQDELLRIAKVVDELNASNKEEAA